MAYKEKTCPKCQTKHTKRGEFCSRSCGNQKKHTAETKQLLSKKQTEWLTSGDDRAEVIKHNYVSKRINGDPDPVAPPVRAPLADGQFVQDGDLWSEC
jgi:predicted amidophosphoribosyltransferase